MSWYNFRRKQSLSDRFEDNTTVGDYVSDVKDHVSENVVLLCPVISKD